MGLNSLADSFMLRFDLKSNMMIERMRTMDHWMVPYYTAAMRAVVNKCLQTALTEPYTPRLTGTLARSLRGRADGPFEGRLYSTDTPYAARREYGFDGRTDSLGRTFANGDPLYTNMDKRSHMMYLHRAIDDNRGFIEEAFITATKEGFTELGRL